MQPVRLGSTKYNIGYRSAVGLKAFDACIGVINAVATIEQIAQEWIQEAAQAMRFRFTRPCSYRLGYWPKGEPDRFVLVGILRIENDPSHCSGFKCAWHLQPIPLPPLPVPLPDFVSQDQISTEDDDSVDQ